jgi:hypothetical protein
MSSAAQPPAEVATILLYASDRLTREDVRLALGRRLRSAAHRDLRLQVGRRAARA